MKMRRMLLVALPFCLVSCGILPSGLDLAPTETPVSTDTAYPPTALPVTSTPTRRETAAPTATPAVSTPTPQPAPTIAPSQTPVPTAPPSPTAAGPAYYPAFGIDYAQPDLYLDQGAQTQLSDPAVVDHLRAEGQSLAQLGDVYRWLHDEFTGYSGGGRTIGVATAEQLLAERRLSGCHDYALVYAAVVRELGYPAVMVESYSIAWIEQFQAGEATGHVGHVFVEVYLGGRWVLTDPTNGWYVDAGYNPADPVIPLEGPIAGPTVERYGFYVDRKGVDTWGYGIHSPSELTQAMDAFAHEFDLGAVAYPAYAFRRFAR